MLTSSQMEPSSAKKKWRLWIGAYLACWTALALLGSFQAYLIQLRFDKPVSWTLAMRRSAEEVYTYALLTVGILWFCQRMSFEAGRFWRWFLSHMGMWVVFSVCFVAMVAWLWAGQKSVQTGHPLKFWDLFQRMGLSYLFANLFVYWMIVLGHLGWQYYRRFSERERQAAALTTELVQARLEALRMQINPHFLFNTLNTISALVHEKPEEADRVVVQLSRLLRRTLDNTEIHEVPLRDEIDFLKGYLEIEQMRFPDRLTVIFDYSPSTQELLVPRLILQPLVENALRHGVMPREEPGRIVISAQVDDGILEMKVRDDGQGLASGGKAAIPEGIGLRNVRSRLAHLYGAAQSLELRNAPGGGAEAVIRIPCCTIPRSQAPRILVLSEPERRTEGERAASVLPMAAPPRKDGC
jgi:two-component system, LytTR family, sensor kinase